MAAGVRARSKDAVVDVVERITEMLYSMTLLPGQSLRQESLAAELEVSRAPVREALRVLQSQGMVTHERNVGYSVRRISRGELHQAYRVRELLEAEVLGALGSPDPAMVRRIKEANESMREALERGDLMAARKANHTLHFELFRASGQQLIVEELERVWRLTQAYRSYYLADPRNRERILREHDEIISAYEHGCVEQLVERASVHRSTAAALVGPLLMP